MTGLLRNHDYRRLNEFIHACLQASSEDLPSLIISNASTLIAADAVDYRAIEPRTGRNLDSLSKPALGQPFANLIERLLPNHPMVTHFTHIGDGPATRFSDLLNLGELKRVAIFQDFYRPLGFPRLMATLVPTSANVVIGVALCRGGRDFTDRERELLQQTRPFLSNILISVQMRVWVGAALLALQHTDDSSVGLVLLGPHGLIMEANKTASRLLDVYCRRRGQERQPLPEELGTWLAAQQPARSCELPRLPVPYRIQRGARTLTVTLVGGVGQGVLLLRETVDTAVGPMPAVPQLTHRQTQVLWLVAQGKTNRQIAGLLGISIRTVETHLDDVYQRLSVPGRAAAVHKAFNLHTPPDTDLPR
jgi:DNA-binding CsgD family transcriptional regulator